MTQTGSLNKKSVLLVDDDWMNRELMQNFLERAGYRALHANSGEKALETAAAQMPALVLCDVRMTGMDGMEFCATLKATPDIAAIPVIILTAYETPEERQRALDAGADAFVSKMEGWSRVIEQIQQMIG